MSKDIVLTEEEQIEQTKKWLKNNLPSIAIGIAAGLVLVFGYNYYQDKKAENSQDASGLYEQVIKSDDSLSRASQELEVFQDDYAGTPYASKVALLSAKHAAESKNIDQALANLTWAIDNTKEDLVKHTAILRKASVLVSINELDKAEKLLSENKTTSLNSFYFELLGDVAIKKEQFTQAVEYYQSSLDSSQDPRYNTYLHLKLNKATSLSAAKTNK